MSTRRRDPVPDRPPAAAAYASAVVATPVGRLRLILTADEIVASAWLDADERAPRSAPGSARALIAEARAQIARYGAGRLPRFSLPLRLAGAAFETAVLRAVAEVPFGATASYGEVARAAGRPGAHRGVARAIGASPFALLVPAHRIVGADGRVKGAAPGSARPRLLAFEAAFEARAGADA